MKNLLSVKQVAEILGVHHSRVRALIASGRIKATKLGTGAWMISDYKKAVVRKNGRPVK